MKIINKKSKGITTADAVVFVAVIGILTMIIFYVIDYSLLGERIQVFVDSSRMYSLSIISGNIKNFLKFSSQYSFEQGTYDVLKSGVLSENSDAVDNVAIWLENQADKSPTKEDLEENISARYEEILLQYLNQLKDKQSLMMNKPSIVAIKLNLSSNDGAYPPLKPTVNLTAFVRPIKIGTSDTQYLLVNSTVIQEFNFLIEDIFDEGKELLAHGNDIANAMKKTDYCMSDDEIKNKICQTVEQKIGETNLIKWNFACDKNKIGITKESTEDARTLKLKVYSLAVVEDKKSNAFILDNDINKWGKFSLQYYINNTETTSVECCPGDTKSCIDSTHGCSGTQTCGNDYKWGECKIPCVPSKTTDSCTKQDGSKGVLTCVKSDTTCQYECQ